jgi:hypothetical protein
MKDILKERFYLASDAKEIVETKADIACMLDLYKLNRKHVMAQEYERWNHYDGPFEHDNPIPLTQTILKHAYNAILKARQEVMLLRRNVRDRCIPDFRSDKREQTRDVAVNELRSITSHDNPTVHFKDTEHEEFLSSNSVYRKYSVGIKASWYRDVHKANLSLQDIAGRTAFVVKVVKLVNTKEDYEAYAAVVVTVRRPISHTKQMEVVREWESRNLDSTKHGSMVQQYAHNFKHPAFLVYENRYIVRTMSTSGWQSTTGTTVNWAASTLKRRMKTLMLKKLKV